MALMKRTLSLRRTLLYSITWMTLILLTQICPLSQSSHAQYHNIYGKKQLKHQQRTTSKTAKHRRHERTESTKDDAVAGRGASQIDPLVELVVVGPALPLFSRFGHIGLRIKSTTRDVVYDLGLAQHGGWKGFKDLLWGQAEFTGEVRSFPKMLSKWKQSDRDVSVYPLYIGDHQFSTLYRELEARVGGRVSPYLYDPLRENCATQLRQVLDSITQGLISRVGRRYKDEKSLRDEIYYNYAQLTSILTAIELWGGVSVDQSRNLWELSAIPKYLIKLLKQISVGGQPLLGKVQHLHLRSGSSLVGGLGYYTPLVIILSILTLLFFPIVARYRNPGIEFNPRYQKFFSFTLRLGPILMGGGATIALIFTLNSGWIEVRNSWQLYMCTPLDLLLLLIGTQASLTQIMWGKSYLLIRGSLALILSVLICLQAGATPPLSLICLMTGTWLSCFMCLRILESKLRREHYEHSLEASEPDEISWIKSEPVDFL